MVRHFFKWEEDNNLTPIIFTLITTCVTRRNTSDIWLRSCKQYANTRIMKIMFYWMQHNPWMCCVTRSRLQYHLFYNIWYRIFKNISSKWWPTLKTRRSINMYNFLAGGYFWVPKLMKAGIRPGTIHWPHDSIWFDYYTCNSIRFHSIRFDYIYL